MNICIDVDSNLFYICSMKHFAMGNDVSGALTPDMNGQPKVGIANWRGRSGQFYALTPQSLDSFVLEGQDLYLLISGNEVLWLGTGDDIVKDTSSRACFRTAVKMATAVFRLPNPGDDITAMRTRWDIEGGQLAGALALVS